MFGSEIEASEAGPDVVTGVGMGHDLAAHDFQDGEGHGFLLHFAGIDHDGSDPGAALANANGEIVKAHEAAGEENGVHVTGENGAHGTDALADLINHGVPDEDSLRISLVDQGMDGIRIRGAEEGDEAAGAGAHAPDIVERMGLQIIQELQDGDAADARRSKGAIAIGPHGAVDHAAMVMGADGDAAIDMGDDKITILIVLAQGLRVGLGDGLGIENVGMGRAIEAADAGEAGIITILIHIGGIEGVGGAMVGEGELPGEHDAQLGGVLAATDGSDGILIELPVDGCDAGGLGAGAAAATDEDIDLHRVEMLLGEEIQDYLIAEGNLVIDMGILEEDRGVMKTALLEELLFIDEEADFGGGGTGVDDEHFIVHGWVFKGEGSGRDTSRRSFSKSLHLSSA